MKMFENGAGIGSAALQNGSATLGCPSFPRFLMTYSRSELAAIDVPMWFCLRTHPKHEHIAAAGLRRQFEIGCFSPRLRFRKATRRGAVWFVEPMFPGYLFAEFIYASMHRAVEHASGVHGIVHFGDYLATIDPIVVAALQEKAGDEEVVTIDPEIKTGEAVHIAEGPFQGLEAVVTRVLPARQRVRVLLEFLGRSVETEISMPKVLPTKR
jgi:transcriptional antiterminator RfaH